MCRCYPVEVMEDVSGVSRSEARRWDADDSHAVRDLHLLLHPWQVVWLALTSSSARHITELHRAVIQPLQERAHKHKNTVGCPKFSCSAEDISHF